MSQAPAVEASSAGRAGGAGPPAWECDSRSAAETDRLGQALGRLLRGGEVIALYGNLGTGKTAFVRGMAAGLNAPRRAVSSPTFVLVHAYGGRLPLVHADLYRLESADEFRHVGLDEHFDDRTVMAVEWAEKAGHGLPGDRLDVHFAHVERNRRRIRFRSTGTRSRRLLHRMMAAQTPHPASNPSSTVVNPRVRTAAPASGTSRSTDRRR